MAGMAGHAAMIVMSHTPDSVTAEQLPERWLKGAGQLGLAICRQFIVDVSARQQAGSRWVVSVYGPDGAYLAERRRCRRIPFQQTEPSIRDTRVCEARLGCVQ
jgi:hypothetical protein